MTMARRLGSHPLLLRFALLVIAPLGIAGAAGLAHLRHSLPTVRGELKVQGLRDAVMVERDRQGVPHIRARSDHDAFFARMLRLGAMRGELLFAMGPEADARRERALAAQKADPSVLPDTLGLGPDAPCDDLARARYFGEA